MTRKFSLEEDFMNLTSDDLVLGYLQHIATFHPEEKVLYVPLTKVSKEKKDIALIIDKTPRTAQNKINKLIENGLISKRIMKLNGKDTEVYEIPQDTSGRYKIIDEEMMWYLVSTRKLWALKIYVYLLNKYDWKKQEQGEMYSFTCGELAQAIGYTEASAATGSISSIISNLLISFKREGVLNYEDYSDGQSPRKRLTFVAHKPSELPQA